MRLVKLIAPVAIAGFGLFFISSVGHAKPEYSKKEKKGCTFCHVKAGSKDLNDAGTYYKAHDHSLEGYTPK